MFDSVSSVLSVFAKLIKRLEAIKEKQQMKIDQKADEILRLRKECVEHEDEVNAADKAIAKLKVFTDE